MIAPIKALQKRGTNAKKKKKKVARNAQFKQTAFSGAWKVWFIVL